jgi:hypothetical protein
MNIEFAIKLVENSPVGKSGDAKKIYQAIRDAMSGPKYSPDAPVYSSDPVKVKDQSGDDAQYDWSYEETINPQVFVDDTDLAFDEDFVAMRNRSRDNSFSKVQATSISVGPQPADPKRSSVFFDPCSNGMYLESRGVSTPIFKPASKVLDRYAMAAERLKAKKARDILPHEVAEVKATVLLNESVNLKNSPVGIIDHSYDFDDFAFDTAVSPSLSAFVQVCADEEPSKTDQIIKSIPDLVCTDDLYGSGVPIDCPEPLVGLVVESHYLPCPVPVPQFLALSEAYGDYKGPDISKHQRDSDRMSVVIGACLGGNSVVVSDYRLEVVYGVNSGNEIVERTQDLFPVVTALDIPFRHLAPDGVRYATYPDAVCCGPGRISNYPGFKVDHDYGDYAVYHSSRVRMSVSRALFSLFAGFIDPPHHPYHLFDLVYSRGFGFPCRPGATHEIHFAFPRRKLLVWCPHCETCFHPDDQHDRDQYVTGFLPFRAIVEGPGIDPYVRFRILALNSDGFLPRRIDSCSSTYAIPPGCCLREFEDYLFKNYCAEGPYVYVIQREYWQGGYGLVPSMLYVIPHMGRYHPPPDVPMSSFEGNLFCADYLFGTSLRGGKMPRLASRVENVIRLRFSRVINELAYGLDFVGCYCPNGSKTQGAFCTEFVRGPSGSSRELGGLVEWWRRGWGLPVSRCCGGHMPTKSSRRAVAATSRALFFHKARR